MSVVLASRANAGRRCGRLGAEFGVEAAGEGFAHGPNGRLPAREMVRVPVSP
jgi:hypothetical protein